MAGVDIHSITQPVGIMRIFAIVLTCLTFSLAASAGSYPLSYWAWCMFTWCFCCFFSLLILVLEFVTVSSKVPWWDDLTAGFAILASLMCLTASIIYPILIASKKNNRQIAAAVVSWMCFGVYVAKVVITRLRPRGQTSGFLSTPAGIMKMLEILLTCLIFASLDKIIYGLPGLRWCVAVFSLCFIFAMLIIVLTVGQLTTYCPISFDKIVVVYNALAAAMYITAVVIWPLYSFKRDLGPHNKIVAVTTLTVLNCVVYILDTAHSIRTVFFARNSM